MNDEYKDQEWQDRVGRDASPVNNEAEPGLKTYQLLYEALAQSPPVTISEGFAERIAQQAIKKYSWGSSSYWWLAIGLVTVATLVCGGVLFIVYPSYFLLLQSKLPILGFAGLMFTAIQVADYWLIQQKQKYIFT